jgi:four helix bundle protein
MSCGLDKWISGLMDEWINATQQPRHQSKNPAVQCPTNAEPMEYTKRRNLNRGDKKLEAWQRGMDLFALAHELSKVVSDLKLKSQFRDAAQSVSANISEGYGRRTLPEYLQFLYTAKGSMAETSTRSIGLKSVKLISDADFEEFDKLHYEVEIKLFWLIESLEAKRGTGEWRDTLPPTHPSIHSSINPSS